EAVADMTSFATNVRVATELDDAFVVYPFLCKGGNFAGVALALEADPTDATVALNTNNNANIFHTYRAGDAGSIFALVVVDEETVAKGVIHANVAKLEPYVDALPESVATILTTAISEIKALTYSENIFDKAAAIVGRALTDANAQLATSLGDMTYSLKSLCQGKFISIANGEWIYDAGNTTAETAFTLKVQPDGGYILYNGAANLYVGQVERSTNNVSITAEKADALVVYPFLSKSGFAGVALAIEPNPASSTLALNASNDAKLLHISSANNAGSIFALVLPGSVPSHNEAIGIIFEGIIGNVGETVAIGAKVLPANVTDPVVAWTSSNPEVAAVDADGVVWFNAVGSATVTAECQGYELSVPFVVKEVAANALNVFPVEAVGGVGHEFSLLALHEPENTTDKSVTWESSDPEVATVSEDGRVSLAAIGSAQITARSGEHSAVCAVTVDETVGLTEMASTGVVIDVVEGGIVVRNAPEGESIAVYAVDGKVVNGAVVEGDETKLSLAAGIYIVKVSPATVGKVLIK
ncbi:MAG: Ig-like domain-containing protein, partial [Muribaculaceae bacterium]|nr:Ig-like domain-containing protein [Muribaculaceae bacterium]